MNLKKIIILSSAIFGGLIISHTLNRCGYTTRILNDEIKYQNRASSESSLTLSLLQDGNISNSDSNKDTYYYSFYITIENQENDLFSITNSLNYNLSLIIDFASLEYVDVIVNGERIFTFDDMIEPFLIDITTSASNTFVQLKSQDNSINGSVVNFQIVASKNFNEKSYQNGYDYGYEIGKQQGEELGYLDGYDEGIIAGGNINSVEWLKSTFNSVAAVLTIEPFPGLSFATILSIPLIVSVVKFILGWFI